MLADDLEGTAHRAYGMTPNMSYILSAGGTILYRASWTDERTIRAALEHILYERSQRRAGTRVTPYYMEWYPHRANDREVFMDGLQEIGSRAVEEFITATQHSDGEDAAQVLLDWKARRQAQSVQASGD